MDEGGLSRRGFLTLAAGTALASALPAGLAGCAEGEDEAGSSEAADGGSGSSSSSGSSDEDVATEAISLFLFDTYIDIEAACSAELLAEVSDRLEYFEETFSRTIEGSDIWNINEAAGKPVEVSEETADIIRLSIEYSEESDGLFDISIGAASTLWDFDEGTKPDDDELAEAVSHIDYRCISVDGTTVTLSDPDAKLDLGGIAKGYITDDIVAMLREGGCEQAVITLGGNVYVMGASFDGDEWSVGIQDPNGERDDTVASRKTTDLSVVTSGLYERCFEEDGVLYYHILDPKTGYPAETDLESSSIVCEESTAADAYATILFLEGHDAAVELVEEDERFVDGLFIDDEDRITTVEGSSFEVHGDEA